MESFFMDTVKCNLLLIGISGAGKSTFANYLFGVDVFTTGTGMPVTAWEDNFQQHSLNVSDTQINVYDSVGLEPKNFNKWIKELESFLNEKQSINSANEIIHVCFYLINVGNSRVEPNEISLIKKISNKYSIPVYVILTNCDVERNETKLHANERIIEDNGLESIRVCSISRTDIFGNSFTPFGKDLALKRVLEASYEKVGKDLVIISLKSAISFFNDIRSKVLSKIDESKLSVFDHGFDPDKIDEAFDNILDELNELLESFNFTDKRDVLPPIYNNYVDFLDNFDINFKGRDILEETFIFLDDIDINFDNIKTISRITEATENIDSDNFLEKVGAFGEIAITILFLKTKMKEVVNESIDTIISVFQSNLEEFKKSQFYEKN